MFGVKAWIDVEMYEYPVDKAVSNCVFQLLLMAADLVGAHIIITQGGVMFCEAEILRWGNEQLLDDLEEGLVILEDKPKI